MIRILKMFTREDKIPTNLSDKLDLILEQQKDMFRALDRLNDTIVDAIEGEVIVDEIEG